MARKCFIEEPEYYERGHKSTIIYYNLMIPVIFHRFVASFKVFLAENIPHKGIKIESVTENNCFNSEIPLKVTVINSHS